MFRDRVDIATEALDGIRWPFQRLAWAVEDRVVWPLQDLAGGWDRRGRAAMAAGLVLAAGVAATAGALWAGDGTTAKTPEVSTGAALTAQQAATKPQPKPEGPVLQGATPVFGAAASGANAKEAAGSVPASTAASNASSGGAATEAQGGAVAPKSPDAAVVGVARRFAAAFVLYEIGLEDEDVRKAFNGVATPALAKALANRPPRQPEEVDVPKAKVLNVVLGPRRGKSFRSASVSLLRVGSVSELRVDLRRTKSGWLVSDVRG